MRQAKMRRQRILLLLALAPLLTASSEVPLEDVSKSAAEEDTKLKQDIVQLEVVIDSQIRDIGELTSRTIETLLRDELARWTIDRNKLCADIAEDDAGDLQELEAVRLRCVLHATESKYVELEERIGDLEKSREKP